MTFRRFLPVVLLVCASAASAAPASPPVIAVIPKGTTHEFWKSIHAGAVKAGRARKVEILWKGPLKEDDREGQIAVVEDMIRRRVAGIVLAPLDDTALVRPVEAAVKAGIPVIIIDSGLRGSAHASFVATDNEKGGRLAGEHLAKLLKGRGKVLMLRYQQGSASTELREKGFLAAIRKHRGLTVVSDNQHGGATTETAYRAAENLLAPLKRADGIGVDGIFCPNESTTFGMLRALQDAGVAGKVRFVGFDASAKLVEGLKTGHIDGLILQNPFKMGELGVGAMADLLARKKITPRVDTGVGLVTKANMDTPGTKELLEPDLAKWLD